MKWVTDFFNMFDIAGGAILGIHSLVVIALSIAAFVINREIPGTVVGLYTANLTAFAITKTYKLKLDSKPV